MLKEKVVEICDTKILSYQLSWIRKKDGTFKVDLAKRTFYSINWQQIKQEVIL